MLPASSSRKAKLLFVARMPLTLRVTLSRCISVPTTATRLPDSDTGSAKVMVSLPVVAST